MSIDDRLTPGVRRVPSVSVNASGLEMREKKGQGIIAPFYWTGKLPQRADEPIVYQRNRMQKARKTTVIKTYRLLRGYEATSISSDGFYKRLSAIGSYLK